MSVLANRWLPGGLLLFFFCLALTPSGAFFGLTAHEPLATLSWEVQDNVLAMDQQPEQQRSSRGGRGPRPPSARQLCQLLKLPHRQARMCRRGRGVPQTLLKATRLSVLECQHQFKYERWNCSLGHYRQKILQKGTKETSFLYAISSAGLVHEVSRACSQGTLDRCTCDQSNPAESKRTWQWGGCGDNIRFGLRFTRRFLKKARKSGKDIRARVDQHNSRVGIKVVKNEVNTTCKCHGVSGSCTVKTCWLQLSPFHSVGNILKRKYEHAQQAFSHTNKATGRTQLSTRRRNGNGNGNGNGRDAGSSRGHQDSSLSALRRGELAYIEESPSFCSRSRYSPGTQDRVCSKESSCDSICCGRGYNVQYRKVKKACHCEVFWCCRVTCKVCWLQEEIYMCK